MGRKDNGIIPNLKTRRPSRKSAAPAPIQSLAEEGTKRLAVDVPASIYARIDELCRERGITKRDYVLELLRRDGVG